MATSDDKATEPTYSQDRLIQYAHEYLDVAPSVAAGALLGQRKQNFTVAEAKRACDNFLKGTVDYAAVEAEEESA